MCQVCAWIACPTYADVALQLLGNLFEFFLAQGKRTRETQRDGKIDDIGGDERVEIPVSVLEPARRDFSRKEFRMNIFNFCDGKSDRKFTYVIRLCKLYEVKYVCMSNLRAYIWFLVLGKTGYR